MSAKPRRPLVERVSPRNRFAWPFRLVRMLGRRTDAEIAERVGLHHRTVAAERERRGIPACRPRRAPIEWSREMIAALGSDTDGQVAGMLGVSRQSVARKRRMLHIPPYVPPPHDKVRRRHWPATILALLGKVTDREVAELLGVAPAIVTNKRLALGIAALRPRPPRIRWTAAMDAFLGTAPDKEVARRLGVPASAVKKRRQRLGMRAAVDVRPVARTPRLRAALRLPTREARRRTGLKLETIKQMREEFGIVPPTFAEWRWRPVRSRLGKEPDRKIAADLGVSKSRVAFRRRQLGIPPPERTWRPWQPREIALLGTAPDGAVARRLGRATGVVWQKRQTLAIPAYRSRPQRRVGARKNAPRRRHRR